MRYLKNFNEMITNPSRLIKADMNQFLKNIELYHIGDKIWAIKVDDSYTRAMLFLRSQEYYESAFDEIIGKQFKFSRYIDIYKAHYGKQEFTYGDDWSGFNIPSTILKDCMNNIEEGEINTYDRILLSIMNIIDKKGDDKYYLLGVDTIDGDVLEHEIAHAMWFNLPDYKKEMMKLNSELDEDFKSKMIKCIADYGYADHVYDDELQAYMSTGFASEMKKIKLNNIKQNTSKYRVVFDKYYKNHIYTSPELVKIDINV